MPVYKSGYRIDVTKYQPISLLDNFCKLFKYRITDELSVIINIVPLVQKMFQSNSVGPEVCAQASQSQSSNPG